MDQRVTSGWLLIAVSWVVGCQSGEPDPSDLGGEGGGAPASAPFEIASYPDGAGDFILVPISVEGGPQLAVLLDTGSDGLRVFEDALQGAAIDVDATAVSVEFGFGSRMVGHVATGRVRFGDVATATPVAFHLVESFECAPDYPGCDFAAGDASALTDAGIHGILGVSTRPGSPAEIFSPFAQLGSPLSRGFVLRTGGFGSTAGEIAFGLSPDDVAGFATTPLSARGSHPNGAPAWSDDTVQGCFAIAGTEVVPPCTDTVFDTGSTADVVYAPGLPPEHLLDGALAPGVSFATKVEGALDRQLTVAAVPTPGVDLVFVDDVVPFAVLGMSVFYGNDVLFDLEAGEIGFRPL